MNTNKLIAIIERSKDCFGAWVENLPGVYGAGDTVEDTKKNLMEALTYFIEDKKAAKEELPEILKGTYEIEYQFEIKSFLNYYSGVFTFAGLERLTGINQKQLGHYAAGVSKPRATQVKRIDEALHRLSRELSEVHFYQV